MTNRVVDFPRSIPAAVAQEAGGIPVNLPEGLPEIGSLGFEDFEAAFNSRAWLQRACESQGAKITGGGYGGGSADVDIELDGCNFLVSIRALRR